MVCCPARQHDGPTPHFPCGLLSCKTTRRTYTTLPVWSVVLQDNTTDLHHTSRVVCCLARQHDGPTPHFPCGLLSCKTTRRTYTTLPVWSVVLQDNTTDLHHTSRVVCCLARQHDGPTPHFPCGPLHHLAISPPTPHLVSEASAAPSPDDWLSVFIRKTSSRSMRQYCPGCGVSTPRRGDGAALVCRILVGLSSNTTMDVVLTVRSRHVNVNAARYQQQKARDYNCLVVIMRARVSMHALLLGTRVKGEINGGQNPNIDPGKEH